MKKFNLFVLLAVVLTIFSACQKDDIQVERTETQAKVYDAQLMNIGFSVDNNCLVLKDEEEFQKLLDYLVQKGDDSFPEFEKTVGFDSYRSYYEENPGRSEKLVDDLIATVISPKAEIQIGNHLFKINFKEERTEVYTLRDSSSNLKSSKIDNSSEPTLYKWTDDIFGLLNHDAMLKSYCTSDQDKKYDEAYFGGDDNGNDFWFTAQAKLNYQNFGFVHTIISKFKIISYLYSDGQRPIFIFKMNLSGYYDRRRESRRTVDEHIEGQVRDNDDGISWRPFYGTRRVESFSLTSKYSTEVFAYGLFPFVNGYTDDFAELNIGCN